MKEVIKTDSIDCTSIINCKRYTGVAWSFRRYFHWLLATRLRPVAWSFRRYFHWLLATRLRPVLCHYTFLLDQRWTCTVRSHSNISFTSLAQNGVSCITCTVYLTYYCSPYYILCLCKCISSIVDVILTQHVSFSIVSGTSIVIVFVASS